MWLNFQDPASNISGIKLPNDSGKSSYYSSKSPPSDNGKEASWNKDVYKGMFVEAKVNTDKEDVYVGLGYKWPI